MEFLRDSVKIRHSFQMAILHGPSGIGIIKESLDDLLSRSYKYQLVLHAFQISWYHLLIS